MAKGAELKKEITQKILGTFDSFLSNDGKEIRIVGQENGEEVQIKVTLTCAKVNIAREGDKAVTIEPTKEAVVPQNAEISKEEKDTIDKLIKTFNL